MAAATIAVALALLIAPIAARAQQAAAKPDIADQNTAAIVGAPWQSMPINGMTIDLLLPQDYSPQKKYPVILYLHQLDMGNWPAGLLQEVDPWFLAPEFRKDYQALIIMPMLDQTNTSGMRVNFGGASSADQPGQDNAIAAVRQVMSKYSIDRHRIYVTGNSMGGIGSWDVMVKYNASNGTNGRIFAAGMPLAGAIFYMGRPTPDLSVINQLRRVPIWAIHGANDNQVPLFWDQAMAKALAGSKTFHYTEDPNLAHDVWDTYYALPKGATTWDWLFAQRSRVAAR
jgi:predicted peptidase